MNTVQQMGRLTAAPGEVRATENGRVTAFRIAVPRAKGGAKEADFFQVEAWNELADSCARYLAAGREVAVVGRLAQQERVQDDQRRERVVIVARSVDFLRVPRSEGESAPTGSSDDVPF